MIEEKENKLIEKYSSIGYKKTKLVKYHSNNEKGYVLKEKYFKSQCEDGWFQIIDACLNLIKNHIESNRNSKLKEDFKDFQIEKIKQKFGVLRIEANIEDSYISGVLSMAAAMSYRTCEFCGTTLDVIQWALDGRWVRSICNNCIKEKK
jgi:hypothetical protein